MACPTAIVTAPAILDVGPRPETATCCIVVSIQYGCESLLGSMLIYDRVATWNHSKNTRISRRSGVAARTKKIN